MNISRIILFAIVLLVLRVVVSAVVAGPETSEELNVQVALGYLTGYLLDAAVVIAVLARLARVQVQLPYAHAFFVVALQALLGAIWLFAISGGGPQSPLWLLSYLVLTLSTIVGVEIGKWLRRRSKGTEATKPTP